MVVAKYSSRTVGVKQVIIVILLVTLKVIRGICFFHWSAPLILMVVTYALYT